MTDKTVTRENERRSFWFLALLAGPILAVLVVGGYGLMVWISQLLLGPPGS